MARKLAQDEKPLDWVGSSKKDFMAFPKGVEAEMGNALGVAQFGGKHPSAKPLTGLGSGIFEVVEDHDGNTYRAAYSVQFKDVINVLHAFQKKGQARHRHSKARHRSNQAATGGGQGRLQDAWWEEGLRP